VEAHDEPEAARIARETQELVRATVADRG
jgi:hypothetical protein